MTASRMMGMGLTALAVAAIAIVGRWRRARAATKTVSIPSKVSLSAYGYKGKVTSSNKACASERTVVLKQKGHGVLGRTKSKASRRLGSLAGRPQVQGAAPLQALRGSEDPQRGHRRHDLQVPGCNLEDGRDRRRLRLSRGAS